MRSLSPTLTTLVMSYTRRPTSHPTSEQCSSPSLPAPTSTKAPYAWTPVTVPSRRIDGSSAESHPWKARGGTHPRPIRRPRASERELRPERAEVAEALVEIESLVEDDDKLAVDGDGDGPRLTALGFLTLLTTVQPSSSCLAAAAQLSLLSSCAALFPRRALRE